MAITVRKKRVIDETKTSPSQAIATGAGFDSKIPEIKVDDFQTKLDTWNSQYMNNPLNPLAGPGSVQGITPAGQANVDQYYQTRQKDIAFEQEKTKALSEPLITELKQSFAQNVGSMGAGLGGLLNYVSRTWETKQEPTEITGPGSTSIGELPAEIRKQQEIDKQNRFTFADSLTAGGDIISANNQFRYNPSIDNIWDLPAHRLISTIFGNVGTQAPLMVVPGGITSSVGRLGVKAGLSKGLQTLATGTAGGLSGNMIGTLQETGGAYEEALKKGLTEDQANEIAGGVFKDNTKLLGKDVAEMLLLAGPFKPSKLLKFGGTATLEGGEEVTQGFWNENNFSLVERGEEIDFKDYINSDKASNEFSLGVIGGTIISGGFEGVQYLNNRINKQKNTIKEMAEKGEDDKMREMMEYGVITGELKLSTANEMVKYFNIIKGEVLEKAKPLVDRIAEKIGAKLPLMSEDGGTDMSNIISEDDQQKIKKEVTNYFETQQDPEVLRETIEFLQSMPDTIKWKEDYIGKFEDKIKYVEQGFLIGKEANLNEVYGKDLNTAMSGLYLNQTRANITQKSLDKYTDIANNYPKVASKIEEYLSQKYQGQEVTETVQDVYDKFIEEKAKRSKRIKKPTLEKEIVIDKKLKNELHKNLTELELIQIGKDETGKIGDTALREEIQELGLDPKDFKDTPEDPRKLELMNWLKDNGFMKGTLFTDKMRGYYKDVKKTFPGLGIGTHTPKFEQPKKIKVRPKKSIKKPAFTPQQIVKIPEEKTKLPTADKIEKQKAREKLAKAIQKISKQPNTKDIVNLLNRHGVDVFKQGINYAIQKHMISKEAGEDFKKMIAKQVKTPTQAPTGTITPQQKLNILDMLGYDKLLKTSDAFKINIRELSNSLKEIGARLHIVNAPEGARVKLPFSLMGNKSMTFKNILLPMIKKATQQGAKTYVEPFGGAGTVYYFAEDMINSGIEQLHINHFDKEKYEVIKAIKESGKTGGTKVYHGTNVELEGGIPKSGYKANKKGGLTATSQFSFYSKSKKTAEFFAKNRVEGLGGKENVKEFIIPQNANILDFGSTIESYIKALEELGYTKDIKVENGDITNLFDTAEFKKKLENKGYDGLSIVEKGDKVYGLLDNVIESGVKKDINITGLVESAYNKIIDEIGIELSHIPEIAEIVEDYGIDVGSKEFKELAELSFYPEYAKQFFEERPDTKLAIKGEVTTTFKEWLKEHLAQQAEAEGKVLEGDELEQATDLVLNDRSVFENNYPEISKKISTILDKYDDINIKPGDVDNAMLVSISRHLRQRGDSGQKVVSASSGFQNVINVKNKMIDGLTKYQKVFEKHGDKINIYNQDGKEFIADMGKLQNNKETISYYDPPYIRTTGVYIKNQPKHIQESLDEYADTSKIHQLFEPMKDSIMMFTNDINGPYFEALDTMLDGRMSKDIIGYKEGTTPTSLVTTNEIATKPKDVNLSYYKIVKDSFTKDIMKSLQKGLLPQISRQLEKQIGKYTQHIYDLMQKKFGDLTKIQDEIFKGKEAFENLEESLKTITSGKDKQAIIREAKKWLKQNHVRGAEVVKMIDKINRLWVNRQAKAKQVRSEVDKLKKQTTIDVESKKIFFDWFNKEYTLKKVPEKRSKEVEAIDKVMKGEDFTPEELNIFETYLKDEKFHDKIEDARKESIYNLDIDSLNTLLDTVKYYQSIGVKYRQFKELELEQKIEEERIKAEPKLKKIESTKPLSAQETIKKDNRLKKVGIGAQIKTKKALLEATPFEWLLDEELNLSRTSYNFIEDPINKHRDYIENIAIQFDELSRKLNITKEGWEKITFHGLARRSDGKGKIKLIARMKKTGENPDNFSDILQEQADEAYLNENEKEMYNFMQETFKKLGKQMQETKILLDNEMVLLMDEYFPIQMDWNSNQDKFVDTVDPNTVDNGSQLFRKTSTEQGFTKQATGLELIPELMSDKIFKTHVSNVSYYVHMQKPIKQLNKLVNTWGVEKLGDLGYKYMKDYIDVLARQGILGTQTWLDRLTSTGVRNFQTAVLGFNPTTMALQTSAILEGVSVGGNVDLGAYKDIIKAITGKKEVWDMVTEKSGTVRNREYRNLFGNTTDKFDKGIMEKWNKYGFYGIQKADAVLSRVLWYSEYKRSLKEGKNETDAIYNADTLIKKAMGHTHFEGKAMFVLKNERKVASIVTVFQNFVLNHSAILRYGGGKNVQEKYGDVMGYTYALMFAGLLFALYEELLRKAGRKIHKQEEYGGPVGIALGQMIGFVPYAGILHAGARYSTVNVLSGWKDISNGIDYGDWTRIIKGLGTVMGVGGTAEFDRIYKGYIKEDKKKKSSNISKTISRKRSTRKVRTKRKKRD